MKHLAFIFVMILLTFTVACSSDDDDSADSLNTDAGDDDDNLDDCGCDENLFEPVCGENGKTYSSDCAAECANVKVAFEGKCDEKELDDDDNNDVSVDDDDTDDDDDIIDYDDDDNNDDDITDDDDDNDDDVTDDDDDNDDTTLPVGMVLIEGGEFMMGSPDGEGADIERPEHNVKINAFYMDIYETTVVAYKECVSESYCTKPTSMASKSSENYYDSGKYDNHPVLFVTWEQASNFCEWRGGRLPTEAEWEFAAAGAEDRKWPWGNNEPTGEILNYNGAADTTEVGSFEGGATPEGVFDMAGNLCEWTADWYDPAYYANSPEENPTGPESGNTKVLKGGNLNDGADSVRNAQRRNKPIDFSIYLVGFRCVMDYEK